MTVVMVRGNKSTVFLSFPQEVSWLHSFYTVAVQIDIALIFLVRQSAESQSVRCSESVPSKGSALPVIFSRVNHRGKIGACPVRRCPGLTAS
jgi:hypothetical protein